MREGGREGEKQREGERAGGEVTEGMREESSREGRRKRGTGAREGGVSERHARLRAVTRFGSSDLKCSQASQSAYLTPCRSHSNRQGREGGVYFITFSHILGFILKNLSSKKQMLT